MSESSSESGYIPSRFRVVAVVLFAILNLAVYCVRALSVWRYGSLFSTESGEFLMIYSVWKGMRHLPVYDWPFTYPFSVSLYNYLFYETYSVFLRIIGAWDSGILTWGRLFTSAFAVLGALAQWRLVQGRLNLRGASSALSLLFALSLWFSTSMIRFWALTIRPDLAAISMVMIALWMVLRPSRFGFVMAGLFFYLAWSFKQSVVLTLAAVCLFLLFHKRWRDLSVLVSVFAVLTAATLLLGNPTYRFSILVAPKLVVGFWLQAAWDQAKPFLVENIYWLPVPFVFFLTAGVRRAHSAFRLLITVFCLTFVGGFLAMSKAGGAPNYLLESFIAASTIFQFAVFTAPLPIISFLLLLGSVQPALQLAIAPSGRNTFGTVQLASADEFANAVKVRDRLAQLKKPLFTTDQSFSMPWISTDDHFPALVIDPQFQLAVRQRCEKGGIEGMLQRGEIPTVILNTGNAYETQLNSRYVKIGSFLHQGVPYNQGVSYDIYSIEPPIPSTAALTK
jgi:hypothetical protein